MNLKSYFNLKNVLILTCIILTGSSLSSCKKSDEKTDLTGNTVVKINLKGVEAYVEGEGNTVSPKRMSSKASVTSNSATDVQEMTVPFGNGCSIDVVLTNNSAEPVKKGLVASSGSKLATNAQNTGKPLDKDVKYKVLVYDSQGTYITEKTYSYGSESTAEGIALNPGKTYTFIAYSINSTSSVPNVNNQNKLASATLDNINGELMYFAGTLTLNGGVNYLDIIMKHRFSQITTTMTMDHNMTGSITKIENAVFRPSYSSANLKLSDEVLTYNGLNNAGVPAKFPSLGTGLRTVTSTPALLINPATNNGTLKLGSLTIDGETKSDIIIPNVKINPGQKYNLKLNFKTCTQNVTNDELNWSYSKVVDHGVVGITKDGKFYPKGSTIERTLNIPATDYGFVFDVTELDNAFNMEVNGVKLAKDEIQFEAPKIFSTPSSEQNIEFFDGSKYAGNDVETRSKIAQIYEMEGTMENPLIKVVISKKGEVTMFGSKTSGGELYPLVLTNGNVFNIFPWSSTQPNEVKVTQLVDGRTVIKGIGAGKKKISCN